MWHHFFLRLLALTTLVPCLAMANPDSTIPPDVTAEKLLEATDRVRGGGIPGLEWKLKITATDADADNTEFELLVKASGDNSLAETTFPSRAAGGRLLQMGRNMWFGRPGLQKPVSISSRQKMTGSAANGDIASTNYLKDYDATLVKVEEVEGEPCYLLNLVGKNKWVTYDRIEYWVSTRRTMPIKAAFYTVSGKLLKTAVFESRNEITVDGNRQPFVSKMVIRDSVNTDSVSVLEYRDVKLVSFSRYDISLEALTR
jgi:outer membrane lipoprotein-sorting protein